jgi:peroxiredoxin Q/BCP
MRISRVVVLSAAYVAFASSSLLAQAGAGAAAGGTTPPAQPAAPEVGTMAPDFTLQWADSAGTRAAPVKLSDLRGKVVVIAFYPADRTRGCTAEMTKFRDEYKTLFGENVVVLPISGDGLESHAAWAKEMQLPFALVSDPGLMVAEVYGAKRTPTATTASRHTFVVGKDGKIAWRQLNFQALTEASYTTMATEISKARQ